MPFHIKLDYGSRECFPLNSKSANIGRNNILYEITLRKVSRNQIQIDPITLQLTQVGSNPSLVNGIVVGKGNSTALKENDRITVYDGYDIVLRNCTIEHDKIVNIYSDESDYIIGSGNDLPQLIDSKLDILKIETDSEEIKPLTSISKRKKPATKKIASKRPKIESENDESSDSNLAPSRKRVARQTTSRSKRKMTAYGLYSKRERENAKMMNNTVTVAELKKGFKNLDKAQLKLLNEELTTINRESDAEMEEDIEIHNEPVAEFDIEEDLKTSSKQKSRCQTKHRIVKSDTETSEGEQNAMDYDSGRVSNNQNHNITNSDAETSEGEQHEVNHTVNPISIPAYVKQEVEEPDWTKMESFQNTPLDIVPSASDSDHANEDILNTKTNNITQQQDDKSEDTDSGDATQSDMDNDQPMTNNDNDDTRSCSDLSDILML